MKKIALVIVCVVFIVSMLSGCKKKEEPQTQIPNPVVEVENAQAFKPLGVIINPPAEATDARYSIISKVLAQIVFTLNDAEFTYRGALTSDFPDFKGLAGVYEEYGEAKAMKAVNDKGEELDYMLYALGEGRLMLWYIADYTFTLYIAQTLDNAAMSELFLPLYNAIEFYQ